MKLVIKNETMARLHYAVTSRNKTTKTLLNEGRQ